MELRSSYHTHSAYCDGEGRIEEVVEAAIAANLDQIGISSHAPLPFATEWTMPPARLGDYAQEVRDLQQRDHDHITVLLGAEIDFIPDERVVRFQNQAIIPLGFDYFVGSVHFLGDGYPPRSFDGTEDEFRRILEDDYSGDIQAMAVDYYARVRRMLGMPTVKIVGHLDLVKRWNAERSYFQGDEPWYVRAVEETLDAIMASGHIVELNTAGWRKGLGEPYPASWILARCRDRGIPITVNSDAHAPDQVTWGFDRAQDCLAALGISPVGLRRNER
jgi:histidinol-phosphatase (PHP family)